jgi:HAD superfamily hydrolase (TIGR01509 family)
MDYGGVLTDGDAPLDLVRRARAAGRPTALVSDAHSVPDDVAALFDVLVLGPALGVRKPDPEVFRRTAERLGLAPEECVVVDDVPANLRGARAAGAVVVLHVDPDRTVDEVRVLLDLG